MHLPHFILELALVLAASAGIVLFFRQLRIPAILGLILTGVVIGPSGLGVVSAGEDVRVFAEIGVVALLFTLGLEFSRERVRRVRRPFLVVGPLQLFGTAALVALLGWGLSGLAPRVATFGGFLVALSSTAVVLRLYSQRRELESPQGQIGLGVLLFQDLMLAPMLAVTPLLAGSAGGVGAMVGRFATSAAILLVVFLAVRFLAPPLLGRLIGARLPDIFLMGAVAVCLGMAALTAHLGFSAALGAFLAGVLLAEADYSYEVMSEIGPFRDVFTNFFFVSVGMLLDLSAALAHLPAVLGLAVTVIVVKTVVTFLAALGAGRGLAAAAAAGLGLAQVGEFSFVLAGVGLTQGLLGEEGFQVILGATVVTLLATPGLVALGPPVGRWLARRWGATLEETGAEDLTDHVVLAGYGLNGRHLGTVLREARIPWLALDLDQARVRQARARGEPVRFGDATRAANLEHCAIERARVAVLTLSDPWALRQALVTARRLNPGLFLLVRTERTEEIDALDRLGADEVITSDLETSIELVTRVLRRFHVPRNVIDAEIRLLRADSYKMLRRPGPSGTVTRTLLAALERGTTEIFRLEPASPVIGRTLAQLDLRNTTGATVITVVRDGTPRINPPPDLELQAGDDLVLVGGHAEIEAAFRSLQSAHLQPPSSPVPGESP